MYEVKVCDQNRLKNDDINNCFAKKKKNNFVKKIGKFGNPRFGF